MSRLSQVLTVLLPPLYLGSAFLYGMHFGGTRAPRVRTPRRVLFALTVLAHLALFGVWALDARAFPALGPWSSFSGVLLVVTLLFAVTSWRVPHGGVGALVLGMVALLQLVASALGPLDPTLAPPRPRAFYAFHAAGSIAAAGALVLSGIYGAVYLLLFRRLRMRRLDAFVRGLPSLRTLASLTRRAALAGFLLLTVGLNFGIGWAHYAGIRGFAYHDPYVIVMLALWIHCGFVAFSHRIPGFSARRASFAAAAGLTVLVAASLLSVIPDVSFHWSGGR